MTRPTLLLTALAVAAMALLPGASADVAVSGDVLVRDLHLKGEARQSGDLGFLHVGQEDLAPAATLVAAGKLIEGRQYTEEGYEATADGQAVDTLRLLDNAAPNQGTPFSATQASLLLTNHTDYLFNLFTNDQATMACQVEDGNETFLNHPQLDRGGVHEPAQSPVPVATPIDSSASGGGQNYWSTHTSEQSQVLSTAVGKAAVHVTGTFTVEVIGMDFRLQADGIDQRLHSGTQRVPIQPGMPDTVVSVRQDFLRITIHDGDLRLLVDDASSVQWSGASVQTHAGSLTLEHATGSFLMPNGEHKRLNGATYQIDGHYDLTANPSQQGLQLGVVGLDSNGMPLAPGTTSVRPEAPATVWAIALVALVVAGGTALIVALRRRQPTMADLESALETGHFRRAARDAARILQKRPGFEDALISRAIALSKLGQNRRVVAEVRSHFATRQPSDGVLHYVLGLALKDLGQQAEAEAAWQEAVRRTPGLLAQVQPLLSGQQGSSPTGPVTGLVDGSAYA